jgi:NADH-quinone oxidoreductase subunit L
MDWRIIFNLFSNKFYVDEIYEAIFTKPLHKSAVFIERVINNFIIEQIVNFMILIYASSSRIFLLTQTGQIRVYLFYMLFGISAIFLFWS